MDPEPWPVAGVSVLLSGLDPRLRRLNAGSAPLKRRKRQTRECKPFHFPKLGHTPPHQGPFFSGNRSQRCSPTLTDMAGTWTRLAVEAE